MTTPPLRNPLWLTRITLSLLFVLLASVGCDRASKRPPALPLEELPAALEKAFSKAPPETKDLASAVAALVRSQDYSKAFFALQSLTAKPSLSREQADVTTRGLLTVHGALQSAEAKGDAAATETLNYQRRNR